VKTTPGNCPGILLGSVAAANPGAKNAELIPQLQEQTEKTYSRPTWNLIIKSARERPEE